MRRTFLALNKAISLKYPKEESDTNGDATDDEEQAALGPARRRRAVAAVETAVQLSCLEKVLDTGTTQLMPHRAT